MKAGIIGLGSIAQSTYLPILSAHKGIELVGCYTRNNVKSEEIASQYRIQSFLSIDELIDNVDVVFVHASTISHYEIIKKILLKGKPVYVDKPLAQTFEESRELISIAKENSIPLMIGFNRRYSPVYRKLKSQIYNPTSIHVEKHRTSVTHEHAKITLIDDFIHVVDTLIWLVDEPIEISKITYKLIDDFSLNHISVQFSYDDIFLLASMHRGSGTEFEQVTIIDDGQYLQAINMLSIIKQSDGSTITSEPNLRITASERRGFVDAIHEFLAAVEEKRMPIYFGDESLISQQIVEEITSRIIT